MGVRDTIRGLGCMVKGLGCLLVVGGIVTLVPLLLFGGAVHAFGFVYEHLEIFGIAIGIIVLIVIIAIVLVIANEIGKNSD